MKNKLVKKAVAVIILVAVLVVMLQLQKDVNVCERIATTLSRAWIYIFGNLFGFMPFSVYEVFLVAAIVFAVTSVVLIIVHLCKKRGAKALSLLLTVAITALSVVNVYSLSASFAYNRQPLPKDIYTTYKSDDFSYDQAVDMAEKVVDKLNAAYNQIERDSEGHVVMPSQKQLNALLAKEFERLPSEYFSSYTPVSKTIANKTIMSELHIVGVFFAPFGEANINGFETGLYLPHTMAHEMAHGKGVMRENEANLVASYLLLTSDNPYLSYSGLVKTFYSALSLVSLYPDSQADYARLYASVDRGVLKDMSDYSKFWSRFTLLDDIGNWLNDIYLKLNKQTGSDSYYKPSQSEGTGKKDNDGQEILRIINFSDTQNLLVGLYKKGFLS